MTTLRRTSAAFACVLLAVACGDDGSSVTADDDDGDADGSSTGNSGSGASITATTASTITGAETSTGADTGATTVATTGTNPDVGGGSSSTGEPPVEGPCELDDGQCIFRFDTFGDEQLWTDVLRLHEVVQTLSPEAALALGLKVDASMVPEEVLATADLTDPATTVALLELDAVVGVMAEVQEGTITSIGITCALCHSTVDDAVMPGIGARLDGWPNRDLDPGAIIAATPGLPTYAETLGVDAATASAALMAWGPGRYDARFNQDLMSAPVLIPPAYGLADVELETYTGDGPVSYWNAYVAVTQMGAHGDFVDEELGISIMHDPDLVTPKLAALRDYQFSLAAPPAPDATTNAAAIERGELLFYGDAQCSTCHAGESFTDAPTLHTPEEVGQDPTHATRSKTGLYRTTPLRGAWQHPPYFHDGSAATLAEVVAHYDALMGLGLEATEHADLVAYVSSL